MTCICKNAISVNHILAECPTTTEIFQKNGYDFNACITVKNFFIVRNTDVIACIVKLNVHCPVCKLV